MVTHDSRSAVSRATFFLAKAEGATADERVAFEAFLEASIIFGRAAIHRFKSVHEKHPAWRAWWNSLANDATVLFFRDERNWILKQGPPKIGQKIGLPFIGSGGTHIPAVPVTSASAFYFFEGPATLATETIARHLGVLERLLRDAESMFV